MTLASLASPDLVIHGKVMIGSPAAGNLPGVALASPANQDLTGDGIHLTGATMVGSGSPQAESPASRLDGVAHLGDVLERVANRNRLRVTGALVPPGHHLGDILLESQARDQIGEGTAGILGAAHRQGGVLQESLAKEAVNSFFMIPILENLEVRGRLGVRLCS